MGFKLSSSLGSLAGGAIGAFLGGPEGAVSGAQIGNALLGSNDDEMTALEAYQMQRADALADWNRQNEYNSPVNQMKRLQEAGLNPYLVYSGGNVTGNNSSGLSSVSYGGSYAQPTSKRLQNVLQNLNLRSMQAETKGKEVDTEMRELDLALKKARLAKLGSGGSVTKPLNVEKLELQIEKLKKDLNKGGFFQERYRDFKNLLSDVDNDLRTHFVKEDEILKDKLRNTSFGRWVRSSSLFDTMRRWKYGS